jgi:hypothetical protein
MKEYHYCIVMFNVKYERTKFRYPFGNETKRFWYRFRICLVENRLFRFVPESALLDQTEMFSFDGTDSGMNSDVLVSFLLDVGTLMERLWNVFSFTVLTLLLLYSSLAFTCLVAGKDKRPSNLKEEVQRRLETIERVLETEQVLKG